MSDYTEESVLVTPDTTAKGLKKIQEVLEGLFAAVPPGSFFEMKKIEIIDNHAYIVWAAESNSMNIEIGTDTFEMVNGKIRYQSLAAYIIPKDR